MMWLQGAVTPANVALYCELLARTPSAEPLKFAGYIAKLRESCQEAPRHRVPPRRALAMSPLNCTVVRHLGMGSAK